MSLWYEIELAYVGAFDVRPCVRPSTLSNMSISGTSRPIATNFNLKHYWNGKKAVLCFGPGRIITLVAMTTALGMFWPL